MRFSAHTRLENFRRSILGLEQFRVYLAWVYGLTCRYGDKVRGRAFSHEFNSSGPNLLEESCGGEAREGKVRREGQKYNIDFKIFNTL